MECFKDRGDDWIAPAEFAGKVARVGDSASGARALGGRVNRRTTGSAISATSSVAGYVVAGGGSTRFGQDKAKAELGGKPMLTRICGLVSDTVGSVSVVAPPHRYLNFDVWITEDLWPGQGPLGGIITALLATAETDGGRDWNLIVSCDMPFLTGEWLTYLSDARSKVPLKLSCQSPAMDLSRFAHAGERMRLVNWSLPWTAESAK